MYDILIMSQSRIYILWVKVEYIYNQSKYNILNNNNIYLKSNIQCI